MLSIFIASSGETVSASLRYQQNAILAGEIWRLLTGHLVHLGWLHLWMNLGGFLLIWLLFGRLLSVIHWWSLLFFSSLFISITMLLVNTDIDWYVGLSGVLHAVFVAGALAAVLRGLRAELFLLAVIAGKLAWEQFHGAMPGSEEMAGGNVIVEAHLYGALSGLFYMMPSVIKKFILNRNK